MRGQHSRSEGVRTLGWIQCAFKAWNLACGEAQVSVAYEEQGVIGWCNGHGFSPEVSFF